MRPPSSVSRWFSLLAILIVAAAAPGEGPKRIVFLAGAGSHGFGAHAHNAGCLLLAKCLNEGMRGAVRAVVSRGWPEDAGLLDGADAIVVYCDAGSLIVQHVGEIEKQMKKGAGLACLHYSLDVGKPEVFGRMLDWIGGYYEQHWSVNPAWVADFKELPGHPVTRGVRPFCIHDEWYYHMRFRQPMDGVTPILTAIPPDRTRKEPDGPHSGNPTVRSRMGMPEHVAWVYQRPDGGRGFGLTGGHVHWNWAHNDFRKLVLNAVVWIARAEVPSDGVPSKAPTVEELYANQDSPQPDNWRSEWVQEMIDQFNGPAAAR